LPNKTTIFTAATPDGTTGGFYCHHSHVVS
jgi:hypothetical protein